jgi:hypothetical protein
MVQHVRPFQLLGRRCTEAHYALREIEHRVRLPETTVSLHAARWGCQLITIV